MYKCTWAWLLVYTNAPNYKKKKKRFKVRMTLASRRHGSNFPSDGLFGIKKKLRSWEIYLWQKKQKKIISYATVTRTKKISEAPRRAHMSTL